MHNVLKSSTDWKQVEKKFKEENKLKIKKNSNRKARMTERQRSKKNAHTAWVWERLKNRETKSETESGRERVTTIIIK